MWRRAAWPVGSHRLAATKGSGGGAQHLWRAAVVLAQVDDCGAWEVRVEAVQVVGVGAVPAVDGLVGVADDAQVVAGGEPGAQQGELQRVDVLELVDVEVPEPPSLGVAEGSVATEGPGAMVEQVIEVDHSLLGLEVLVLAVDPADGRGSHRRGASECLGPTGVRLGWDAPGLGPLDLADDVEDVGAAPVAGEQWGDEAVFAVEQVGLALVALTPVGAQLGVGDRVEGAGGHLVAQAQDAQPGPQLAGGLSGEGEGQHALGIVATGQRAPGDAPGEYPGLAGPGACLDRQRQGIGGDGVELLVVEPGQESVGIGVVVGLCVE